MYAMLVEVVEEVRLFTLVDGGQHVFWVQQDAKHPHQLNCPTQLGVRVTDHLLNHHVQQQLLLHTPPTKCCQN